MPSSARHKSAPETFTDVVGSIRAKCGPAKERRRTDRVAIDRPARVALIDEPHQPTVAITLHNISAGGVAFFCKRAFDIGKPLVLPLHVPTDASKLVLCEVRSCKYAHGGLYQIGAEFITSFPDPHRENKIPLLWINRVREKASEKLSAK